MKDLAVLLFLIPSAFLLLSLFKESLIDDVFITLSYSKNLFDFGVWGMHPLIKSNSATSPLNVLLLAIVGGLIKNYTLGVILLTTILIAFQYYLFRKLFTSSCSYTISIILIIILLSNPLLLSTIGLESFLYLLLLSTSIYFFKLNNTIFLGISLGLLTLTRGDGIILFLLVMFYKRKNIQWVKKICTIYLLTISPWLLFSWINLGSIVPITFFIKLKQNWPENISYALGPLLYIKRIPIESLISLIPIIMLTIFIILNRFVFNAEEKILLIFSIIYYLLYSLMGVPPYHWYYAPPMFGIIIVLGFQLSKYFSNRNGVLKFYQFLFIPGPSIVGLALLIYLNGGFSFAESPIHTNCAKMLEYKEVANWLNQNLTRDSKIIIEYEIGTINYYSKAIFFDDFSANDLLVDKIIRKSFNKNKLLYHLITLNFLWYKSTDMLNVDSCRKLLTLNENNLKSTIKSWNYSTKWTKQRKIYFGDR
jgi:hypothetical protein